MVSARSFRKKLLIGYVITLNLKKVVETNLPAIAHPPPAQSLDSWLISIDKKLDDAREYDASSPWPTQSIYRVPEYFRDADETAYTPEIVSLGPYHRDNTRLHEMNRHKWRALHHVLHRTGHNVRLYLDAVRSLENRARACYELMSISTNDFVELLVVDSIFIIELFRGAAYGFLPLGYAFNDPVFTDSGVISSLKRDMIMLENQLPLFVLDRVYALQYGHKICGLGLVAPLALSFFENISPTNDPYQCTLDFDPLFSAGIGNALHCLDLFHRYILLTGPKLASQQSNDHDDSDEDKQIIQLIHCASELHDAGIKFKCRETDRFWDIQFNGGVLEIPHLRINGNTKVVFLNLIAFEQCYLKCGNHITSYISFMDDLINSELDVRYLHQKGIIEPMLENKDVADLFNELCRGITIDFGDHYLLGLTKHVNSYYKKKWNTWKASLEHKYFSNPWTFISLIAASILLLLTFVQTFYAIYDHYWPN